MSTLGTQFRVSSAIAIVPMAALALTACDKAESQAKTAAKASCDGKLAAAAGISLPSDLPTDATIVITSQTAAGATKIFFGAIKGTDIPGTRDALAAKLTAAGYTIKGKDQEKGVEAEAEFAGTHDGTVRVRNLCSGYVEIRYRLEK